MAPGIVAFPNTKDVGPRNNPRVSKARSARGKSNQKSGSSRLGLTAFHAPADEILTAKDLRNLRQTLLIELGKTELEKLNLKPESTRHIAINNYLTRYERYHKLTGREQFAVLNSVALKDKQNGLTEEEALKKYGVKRAGSNKELKDTIKKIKGLPTIFNAEAEAENYIKLITLIKNDKLDFIKDFKKIVVERAAEIKLRSPSIDLPSQEKFKLAPSFESIGIGDEETKLHYPEVYSSLKIPHEEMLDLGAHYQLIRKNLKSKPEPQLVVPEIDLSHISFPKKTDLSESHLWLAKFHKAKGPEIDFSSAQMKRADLSEGEFIGVKATSTNLEEADLTRTNVDQGNFANANLSNAELLFFKGNNGKTMFPNANLSGVNMTGADLGGADLAGADLSESIGGIALVDKKNPENDGRILTKEEARKVFKRQNGTYYFQEKEGSREIDAYKTDMDKAKVAGTTFSNAKLNFSSAKKVAFEDADSLPDSFEGAELQGASFKRKNLTGKNFKGADLRDADFTGAKLDNADLSDTVLDGATLDEVSALETALHGATFDRVKSLNKADIVPKDRDQIMDENGQLYISSETGKILNKDEKAREDKKARELN